MIKNRCKRCRAILKMIEWVELLVMFSNETPKLVGSGGRGLMPIADELFDMLCLLVGMPTRKWTIDLKLIS